MPIQMPHMVQGYQVQPCNIVLFWKFVSVCEEQDKHSDVPA